MASALIKPSTLSIERLHNHYLVPAEHEAPEQVRSLCETAIAATLPRALATALARSFPENDPSLWFIRRLAVDFAVNTDVDPAGLSAIWAGEIAAGVMAALKSSDAEVLHFPDQITYLAHFLMDMVEGSAWGKWYYRQFDGLRMLPVSVAVRTAICQSPEIGLKALSLLSECSCTAVVKSLSAADADRILSAVSSISGGASDETTCFAAINDNWQTVLTVSASEEERRRVLLFLSILRKHPALAGEVLRTAVTALCRLSRLVHEVSASESHKLIAALQRRDIRALYDVAGFDQAAILMPLLRCSEDCLEPLLQRVSGGPVVNPETRRETRFTAFGGAFLLLPLLDQFPLQAATNGWPDLGNISPVTVMRFLILACCFGGERALGCFRDPLLRDLMQIDPQISAEMVAVWLAGISPDNLQTFSREISAWHLETGAAEGNTLQLVPVDCGGVPVLVVVDESRGLWLFAADAESGAENLREVFSAPWNPQNVQCCDSLSNLARKNFPDAELDFANENQLPDSAPDLDYLTLPDEFGCHVQAGLMLSAAAQNLLRFFSTKLSGFARSSLDYLYCNFLDCSAALQEMADQRVVCLGRPPLNLVLAMAGLNRCSYQLSWLGGRACAIFPEG